uniref:Uncharacterized protein n=1 Tax=mine drainage metagenome TaxID=410659 RepID=E6QGH9_9ZZZZ
MLYLAVSMCYIFLIVALLLNCNINVYAMAVGFLATAYVIAVEFRKRRHHEQQNFN